MFKVDSLKNSRIYDSTQRGWIESMIEHDVLTMREQTWFDDDDDGNVIKSVCDDDIQHNGRKILIHRAFVAHLLFAVVVKPKLHTRNAMKRRAWMNEWMNGSRDAEVMAVREKVFRIRKLMRFSDVFGIKWPQICKHTHTHAHAPSTHHSQFHYECLNF